MKAVKKLVSAVLAMVCGIGLAVPVGVSAEEMFPGSGGNLTTTNYSSADINRNGTVDIMDSIALSQYLTGQRYVNSPALMDVDGNHIINNADLIAVTAKVAELGTTNLVDGCNYSFGIFNTTMTYTPSEATTSTTFYRHNLGTGTGASHATQYQLSITDATIPTNNSSTASVIDPNDFYPETDPDILSGICKLSNGGTGFVVGDHMIATAAHNCVVTTSDNQRFWLDSMNVKFPVSGMITSTSPTYNVTQSHIDSYFYNYHFNSNVSYTDMTVRHDYALLIVNGDLSNRYHFPLGIAYNAYNYSNFASYNLYVSGFPTSGVSFPGTKVYTAYDHLYTNNPSAPSVLRYCTDTEGGNSGSPVYVLESVTSGNTSTTYPFTVIGINVAHQNVPNPAYNRGCFITPMMLKFYYNNSHCS